MRQTSLVMRPMLAEFERTVREIRFSTPRIPVVSCVDGVLEPDVMTRPEYWLRQVMEPVRFVTGMKTLDAERVTAYVEIGPHRRFAMVDLMYVVIGFHIWAFSEARKLHIIRWWVASFVLTFGVGIATAIPFFLLARDRAVERRG